MIEKFSAIHQKYYKQMEKCDCLQLMLDIVYVFENKEPDILIKQFYLRWLLKSC